MVHFSKEGIKRLFNFLSIYESCKYKDINFLKYLLSKKKQFENYGAKHTALGNKRKQAVDGIRDHKGNQDKDTFLNGENYNFD